ncbi:MAG: 50S ribosomal protein L20 [Holosporaceae bacterium]|nr:MAG: 50S ribosomal protein L20 [Holosporaceae bacterium]
MARVKGGVTAHARHKKLLSKQKVLEVALKLLPFCRSAVREKSLQYAYRDRRARKRQFRALWIQRINAAVRLEGMTYSQFMNGLNKGGIQLDRKVLSDLAIHQKEAFKGIVEQSKAALK